MLDVALGYAKLGLPIFPLWTALPSIAGGGFICACGKLPGAMWNCCHPQAKCDCSGGLPNCKH